MSEGFTRREFLAGVLATGTLSAAATYLLPGGRLRPSVTLTLVTGVDPTGGRQLLIDLWNQANPDTFVKVEEVTGPTLDQKDKMIGAAQEGHADVLNLDIIHIPHFAQQGYITAIELSDVHEFLPKTLHASLWNMSPDSSRFWAAPFNTDVGMLFERLPADSGANDLVPPMAQIIDAIPDGSTAFAGQLHPLSSASDEAFVINTLEHALSRNDAVLDEDTGLPTYELERWQEALEPLREAIDKGRIRACDNEAQTTEQFRSDGLRYMRNWPREYRVLQQSGDPDVRASRIRVAPLPLGILGGQSLALVNNSAQAARAEEFIRFLTDVPAQKILAAHGLAATRATPYTDPNLVAFIPHLEQVRGSVEQARMRPIHPNYSNFTQAVAKHVENLLYRGINLPSQFVYDMQKALK